MRRVVIIGCGGAGKSTLARALGERTGLPVVHLDRAFWKPGWVESSREEFDAKHDVLMSGERWIIDGNYSRTIDRRIAAADTVVVLDLPRLTCTIGILRRWLGNRGNTRPDMGDGCPEKMDREFFMWVWTFRKRARARQMAMIEALPPDKRVHVLRSRRAVREWLDNIRETHA